MCSTPRPKRVVKGKAGASGSILSNMSTEARSQFAERANVAQERRYKIAQQKKRQTESSPRDYRGGQKKEKVAKNGLGYWLLHASMKEVVMAIFVGKEPHRK